MKKKKRSVGELIPIANISLISNDFTQKVFKHAYNIISYLSLTRFLNWIVVINDKTAKLNYFAEWL